MKSLYDFLFETTGYYGPAVLAVTAVYASLFLSACFELALLFFSAPAQREKRRASRTFIRFFTACSEISKLAVIGGFALTLIGFVQVIEGFRSFSKNAALDGMGLAVMSSACYVPMVALGTLWAWLLKTALALKPDLKQFLGD